MRTIIHPFGRIRSKIIRLY